MFTSLNPIILLIPLYYTKRLWWYLYEVNRYLYFEGRAFVDLFNVYSLNVYLIKFVNLVL